MDGEKTPTKVKDSRHTVIRSSDEPKFEVGDAIPVREGVTGIVLARFTPSGKPAEVHYVVELRPNKEHDSAKTSVSRIRRVRARSSLDMGGASRARTACATDRMGVASSKRFFSGCRPLKLWKFHLIQLICVLT